MHTNFLVLHDTDRLLSILFCASCSCTAEAMVIYLSSVFSMYIILQRFAPSQAIVLCFRLHFTKDNITNNTAAATVRQVVTVVFERMVAEDERFKGQRMSQLLYSRRTGSLYNDGS